MDKKSKILIWVVIILILGSVGATYWRIFVKKDYLISNQVDCDPYSEKCFIWKCDPASTVEGEKCTGDPDTDTWYYKIAERKASNIPLCDPAKDDTCQPFLCAEGEKDCTETLCDDKTKVEQKVDCVDPVQYTIDNPPPADDSSSADCAPDDQECLDATSADTSATDSEDAPAETAGESVN